MEQLTTYRAKGKDVGLIFLFKFDLNGNLKLFEIQEGILNINQMKWLFAQANFPADEELMKINWVKNKDMQKKFEIDIAPADLSFEALWNLYDKKESRKDAEKSFSKLNEADIIKCFVQTPKYKKRIVQSGIAQALLATWINKQRYNDEY